MNPTLLRALVVLVRMFVLPFGAAALFARIRTPSALAQVLGAACLIVVGLAHGCEALNLLPFDGLGS
jgi:hypothetical protein